MRSTHKIVLASNNSHKLDEFRALAKLYAPGMELVTAKSVMRNSDKLGLVEQYQTYEENCVAKARLCNQACHYPALADDSGIEVMALEGKPGVHSARYAIAKAGVSQDEANVQKLLEALKDVPAEKRTARFVAWTSFVMEGILLTARGELEGTLLDAPRGEAGFGYDPIFVPKGQSKTLAELTQDQKNRISHRSIAFQGLMAQVAARGVNFVKP